MSVRSVTDEDLGDEGIALHQENERPGVPEVVEADVFDSQRPDEDFSPSPVQQLSKPQRRHAEDYFTILRLYGPTEAAIDKSWKPGDIQRVK